MRAPALLTLAGLAIAGALLVDTRRGPHSAVLALQIIAGVLAVLALGPLLLRRWPDDPARPGDVDQLEVPGPRRPADAGALVDVERA